MKGIIFLAILFTLLVSGCTIGLQKPDLTVTNLRYDEIDKSIFVKVANEGRTAAKGFTIEVFDGDELIESKKVIGLGEGGSSVVKISGVELSEGIHTIKAVVDPENLVSEISEKNNELEKTFTLGEETQNGSGEDIPPEELNLIQLIQRGKNQENIHYLATTTIEFFTNEEKTSFTSEVWGKNGKIRVFMQDVFEIAGNKVSIETIEVENENIVYSKFINPSSPEPAEWFAITRFRYGLKEEERPVATSQPFSYYQTLYELENAVENEIIGRERIGSRDTLVVRALSPPRGLFGKQKERTVWIWIEKGIPIKVEIVEENGKSTEIITEIDFDPIDDGVFEISGEIDYSGVEVNEPSITFAVSTWVEGVSEVDGQGASITTPNKSYHAIPLSGALVEISGVDNPNSGSCITDEDGNCKIKPFEAGDYDVRVTKEGCQDYQYKEFGLDPQYVYKAERNIAYISAILFCEFQAFG